MIFGTALCWGRRGTVAGQGPKGGIVVPVDSLENGTLKGTQMVFDAPAR